MSLRGHVQSEKSAGPRSNPCCGTPKPMDLVLDNLWDVNTNTLQSVTLIGRIQTKVCKEPVTPIDIVNKSNNFPWSTVSDKYCTVKRLSILIQKICQIVVYSYQNCFSGEMGFVGRLKNLIHLVVFFKVYNQPFKTTLLISVSRKERFDMGLYMLYQDSCLS